MSNQRETCVLWDKQTGEAVYPAIVWQDKRTHAFCESLRNTPAEHLIHSRTGLLLDPYFSASKIKWILEHSERAQTLLANNQLCAGTIDTFIIWHLSGNRAHVTDITNASRTQLFNIHTQRWDQELLTLFDIPQSILPTVLDCDAHFADIDPTHLGRAIPITGVIGDQQAALVGQACLTKGSLKMTYGTGGFLMVNTGNHAIKAENGLLTTVAYRLQGETAYALEGALLNAGTLVQWLRDQLGVIGSAAESQTLAASVTDSHGVFVIPAFTGMGAPYWQAHAKAAILGLSRDTSKAHIVRAALESIAFQTVELLALLPQSLGPIGSLRVDGGMIANDFLMQCIADFTQVPIERPEFIETTVMGAAYVAAVGANLFSEVSLIEERWQQRDRALPQLHPDRAAVRVDAWKKTVKGYLSDVTGTQKN